MRSVTRRHGFSPSCTMPSQPLEASNIFFRRQYFLSIPLLFHLFSPFPFSLFLSPSYRELVINNKTSLTSTLGYSHTISLLLVAPPYIFMVGYSLLHSMLSDKMQNRFWFWIYPQPIVIVGFLLFMFTKSFAARYFSFFLMVFIFALNGTLYAWISDALPRPPAKRAASYAIINSVANTASIWTPYTYATKEAPHYVEPMAINIGMLVLSMICAVILHFYTRKQNKELDRQEAADLELDEQEVARLKKTAEFEGVDLSAARVMQKKHRYMY